MTQGFYEQLGVQPDADAETLRQAYHRQVARVTKRRKELAAQGGDGGQFDRVRAQLDEAWEVLSVPARRQRYDSMLRYFDAGAEAATADALWQAVGGHLVPPSVAAAARLLEAATSLSVPAIGDAPPAPPPVTHDVFPEEPTSPTLAPPTLVTSVTERLSEASSPTLTVPTLTPAAPAPPALGMPRPTLVQRTESDLKVVDGARSSPVIVLPKDVPRQKTLANDLVTQLTDTHGYSGALLRAVREAKGITLEQVADSTRISVRYLQAIEADAHERLPSATFVKGYVREVARLLKLDDEAVVAGYMRRLNA